MSPLAMERSLIITNSCHEVMRRLLVVMTVWILLVSGLPASAREIQIFQTNSTNGNLFPCRCPSEPKGGLAKAATLIQRLSRGREYLLLESGDIFGLSADRKSDSLLLACYRAMGYQAVGVGDQELSRGAGYLQEIQAKFGTPFISANLLYRGRPLVPGYRVVKMGSPDVRVALIGLISEKTLKYYPAETLEGISVLPPEEVLRILVDSLGAEADLLILVSHLGFEEEIELAGKFPQLSLIIGGHSQAELEHPHYSSGVPIIESGASGKRLTRAVLRESEGGWELAESWLYGITSELPDHPEVHRIIGPGPDQSQPGRPDTLPDGAAGVLQVFVASDCSDCERIKNGLLAELGKKYRGRLTIRYHDINDPRQYRLLADYERLLDDRNNQIPVVVIGRRLLGGPAEIERDLARLVREALGRAGNPDSIAPSEPHSSKDGHPAGQDGVAGAADSIYLALVTDLRCQKCGRVEYMIRALQNEHPRLAVRKFDLQTREGQLMAEALGLLYGLPDDSRLKAPAAYLGDDYLLESQIEDQALSALIVKHQNGPVRIPWVEARTLADRADQSIFKRFSSFGLLGVMGAGLLDGINPCSLAVLVFFVSYLAFVGRRRWEILAVGLSYTLADFLVYFLIGIGSLSFLMTIKALPILSRLMYWLAAAAGLGLAIFNFRDYLKARRGDLAGMDLQLSTRTKQRIHRIIRERMGAGGLIGGAFVVGLLTSVLEFACTGQVYLPTIAFVSQISSYRMQAYWYLLLYNLMFEVPMIVTFAIAFWGVSSKRIAAWAQNSVAGVKLATALLFLAMSLALLALLLN